MFNVTGEYVRGGFSGRVLVNFVGDRISDVGSNQAPDIIETGREAVDLVMVQKFAQRFNVRFSVENLTDARYLFTQGDERQRRFKMGRTFGFAFGIDAF
jgi:outer membrane receptor protein involved in Fe transport